MEKIDLVYILGEGSQWGDNEIRYSLRSVETNVPDAGKIFIVGICPQFLDKTKVKHIVSDDPFNHKLKNAIWKLRIACLTSQISDDFMLMNDDFIFLRKLHEAPLYHRGYLRTMKRTHTTHGGYYYKAINDTIELLKEFSVEKPLNYEVHFPMVLNRKKFLKATDLVDFTRMGYLFRSFYGNYYHIGGQYRKDMKIYRWPDFFKTTGHDFISLDNKICEDPAFQKWIDRRFPERSIYEATPRRSYFVQALMNYDGKTYNPGDLIYGDLPKHIVAKNKLKKAWKFED